MRNALKSVVNAIPYFATSVSEMVHRGVS